MFKGKKILITGGTGSLGTALTKKLLSLDVEQIRIFSRNEFKQISMQSELNDDRLRFLIGDIRDEKRLIRATEEVDIVFHAAALKHVPKVEYNSFEAVKTNVEGSQNVIEACLVNDVERAVCIGTDKAVSPLNTYGATKLLMEKLFVNAQHYSNPKIHPTKFFAVRYGNVFASSGSVIPRFIDQIKKQEEIISNEEGFAQPTFSRVIHVRPYNEKSITLKDNRKIQSIGIAINDEERFDLVDKITFFGGDRCPSLGKMSFFDSPWDGMFGMDRMVRWITTYK